MLTINGPYPFARPVARSAYKLPSTGFCPAHSVATSIGCLCSYGYTKAPDGSCVPTGGLHGSYGFGAALPSCDNVPTGEPCVESDNTPLFTPLVTCDVANPGEACVGPGGVLMNLPSCASVAAGTPCMGANGVPQYLSDAGGQTSTTIPTPAAVAPTVTSIAVTPTPTTAVTPSAAAAIATTAVPWYKNWKYWAAVGGVVVAGGAVVVIARRKK